MPMHRRGVDIDVFARGGERWGVDVRLCDPRPLDTRLASGLRAAGRPIHDMAMPFVGQCDGHARSNRPHCRCRPDRCHALRGNGEAARIHYRCWYRQRAVSSGADTAPQSIAALTSHHLLHETPP